MDQIARAADIDLAKFHPLVMVANHRMLFAKHTHTSPDYHFDILNDWYSTDQFVLEKAFRGAAKTTLAEEATALMACVGAFKHCIIIGATETRSKERLTAIKTILSANEDLIEMYGEMLGPVVSETRIVLSNGVAIQALGKQQSLRGVKHNDQRPDFFIGDDMETAENIKTKEAHEHFMRWLYGEVLPSLQKPYHRVRIIGTPLADADRCMISKLEANPKWRSRSIPIRYFNENGDLVSAWPELYPLAEIAEIEQDHRREGLYETFAREYLVEATPQEGQTFNASMFSVVPTARTWQPVYAAVDPARSTSASAAFTGWAAWSIVGSKIHIWEAGAAHIAPDEILNKIFEINDKYNPVLLGVEKDGLELFLMQPLRAEMLRRGVVVPIKDLKAPRDRNKSAFITGLQPYANAGWITLNEPMPDLIGQFISFPKGKIDTINALAYALIMRGGAPIYDFQEASIDETVDFNLTAPVFVLFNSNGAYVTASAVQYINGVLSILSDYAAEGSPADVFVDLLTRVNLDINTRSARRVRLRYIAPPQHFAARDTIGLRASATKARVALGTAGLPVKGRGTLQNLLRQQIHNKMSVRINAYATWTLRGFAGGYFKPALGDASVGVNAEQNIYALFMEALEGFCASMTNLVEREDDDRNIRYATSADGRSYITSRP